MCGRFSQSMTREDYLALLAEEAERDIPYEPEPIGRFNVAPGTKVLLLSERDEKLHLDPVIWGYAPGWWDKPPLINARSETAATSRMFKPLWQHGRAICFADGWYEWKRKVTKSSPTSFIEPMASRYSWRRSAAHHSNVEMKQKDS
ncbi:Putative SOS response-associated peptidase YedK [Citrobacter freundii]|nr:Putative SOS response-associated peptidase YedK [Citrobacter freundii]CAF9664126.1 Putative SOS response-associated peptidase YedK [Citrobacter freundii]CAH4997800.1 Putative SOS response-associated peptidase YedK [Citrobacter freundii]CAH6054594.1 Putative SOS response-associated peptidase YedK [Citrobacter freundii]